MENCVYVFIADFVIFLIISKMDATQWETDGLFACDPPHPPRPLMKHAVFVGICVKTRLMNAEATLLH